MSQDVIEYLPPQSLVVRPQVRKQICPNEEAGLMQSLREVGFIQPIRAKHEGGQSVIIDGHRRTSAAIKLGMATVPVIVDRTALSDSATTLRQVIANVQRSDLKPIEKAEAIRGLMHAENWTAAQAAAKLGLSAPSVARLLALLELPEAIRDRVAAGEIPASAAYELAKVSDPAKQAELAGRLAAGTLTRDGVTAARKTKPRPQAETVRTKSVRVMAMLSADRSIAISAPGLTLERLIEQLEELLGKARRIRTQGVELATFIKMLADQAKLHS